MTLWKVEFYDNIEDTTPSRWGVMVAATEEDVQKTIIANMGDKIRANAATMKVSELPSLPNGTFFWKADNA